MAFELPFILYDNVLADNSTLSVTSEAAGFPLENMVDWLDWTYWKATDDSAQNIDIDKGSEIEVDTLAILGHNFGSIASTVISVWEDDNPSYSSVEELGSVTISEESGPFYIDLISGSQRYNRIRINGPEVSYAAIVYLGKKMTLPVGPEFDFDPDKQNIKSEKFISYSGRMVSSAVRFSEREMNVSFKRIPQSFIDSDLLPFLEDHYGQMKPFFFVPDPGNMFGDDKVYFLTAPDDPTIELPVYDDNINYRNWTLKARGFRQSIFR